VFDLCYRALAEQNNAPTLVRAKCFHTLDAYVRLITLLVKHSGETANTVTKAKQIKGIKSQNEGIEQSGKVELNEKIDILLND
jgi:hypothetical protein